MKKLMINDRGQRYGLDGTSYFTASDGTEYSIDRENGMELAGLLLEALGMDVCERDELLDRLDDQHMNKLRHIA